MANRCGVSAAHVLVTPLASRIVQAKVCGGVEVDGEQLVRLGEPRALELVEGGRRRAGGVGAADGDGGGAEEGREE